MTFRTGIKLASLVAVTVLAVGGYAQAAIMGSATLISNPPSVAFNAPDAALPEEWVSYQLSLASDAEELIGGVDVKINGQLHQRWVDTDFDTIPDPSPNAPAPANGRGDSHLTAVAGALFGRGPEEDNNVGSSPLPDGMFDYGVGSLLDGAWGIQDAQTTADLAYIVVPRGSEVEMEIGVRVANPAGDIIAELNAASFGFGGMVDMEPPVIDPLDIDYQIIDAVDPPPISEQLLATDDVTDATNLAWSGLSYANGPGQNTDFSGQDEGSLSSDGVFSWDPRGWRQGVHEFAAFVEDEAGNSTPGIAVRVDLVVPEPATLALFGLGLVGLVGLGGRRK